ncbi:hypothetical protein D9757_001213 [Collybiopsis confluens]|uniref:Uncharacterized protein n=1 Tax=Collybiopsis confluens TaxID=2823264 RepID=A0A8H5I0Q1_9AGAR|nr:hypothetical protein D9757_001213 [Collybiopsis confluens]
MSGNGVLSSSPASAGGSPLRRRGSSSVSVDELSDSRPRLSPTLVRSFDPNDPQVRERQQTLDMDMAMQLSRARRDTVTVSPTLSPTEVTPELPESSMQAGISPSEQWDIDRARGPPLDEVEDSESILTKRHSSAVDVRDLLSQSHDPSLLVSLGDQRSFPSQDDPSTSAYGPLPTYQANVASSSSSAFNFEPLEAFAASEKHTLGLTSPVTTKTKFSLPPPRNRQFTDDIFMPRQTPPQPIQSIPLPPPPALSSESSEPSSSTAIPSNETADSAPPAIAPSPSFPRQRKLSQSNPQPRSHRKRIGGKLALFENINGGSSGANRIPFSLGPGRSSSGVPAANENFLDDNPPLFRSATVPVPALHTGHDRPYRFSFYTNALPSTIHARSFSELPAEGQTFQDLFAGVHRDGNDSQAKDLKRPLSGGSKGYFPGNVKPSNRSRAGFGGGFGLSSYEGDDPESSTWWLDVLSPTDEEMKMISKASFPLSLIFDRRITSC